jgi:hypothetical protein
MADAPKQKPIAGGWAEIRVCERAAEIIGQGFWTARD